MTQQLLDTTTGAGSTGQDGGNIINANFTELYGRSLGYVPGNWIYPYEGIAPSSGTAGVTGTSYWMPIRVRQPCTINALAARVTTVIASSNFQLAIYANSPATGRPTGSALGSTASISGATAVVVSGSLTANATIQAGIYWVAVNADTSGIAFSAISAGSEINSIVGTPTLANAISSTTAASSILTLSLTYGSWPDVTSSTFTESPSNSRAPIVIFQVFSTP